MTVQDIVSADTWTVAGRTFASRLIVGTGKYKSLEENAAAVEALRGKSADISFMGALPYVLAHDQIGAEVLLSEVYRGKANYVARIFVRRDSGIASVADLAGKTIAFADPISESGYLYPLEIVADAGLLTPGADPQSFFKRVYFAGGYQQAIQAVANGLVDAAGVSQFAAETVPDVRVCSGADAYACDCQRASTPRTMPLARGAANPNATSGRPFHHPQRAVQSSDWPVVPGIAA